MSRLRVRLSHSDEDRAIQRHLNQAANSVRSAIKIAHAVSRERTHRTLRARQVLRTLKALLSGLETTGRIDTASSSSIAHEESLIAAAKKAAAEALEAAPGVAV